VSGSLASFFDEFLTRLGLEEIGFLIFLIDERAAEKAVGKAGGVGHDFGHGGRVDGVFENHVAGGVDASENLEVFEFGDEFGYGIGREPFALLVQLEHGDCGDRLGHGKGAEDGVFGERRVAGDVFHAVDR
jgi:hypothetical protein